MKTNRKALAGGAVLVATAGLVLAEGKPVQGPVSEPVQAQSAQAPLAETKAPGNSDFPVIGHIEKRDRTITIKAGPKGTVYSVKSADGKVLFENLTEEQLRAQAPELHEFIKSAVVGGSGAAMDASVRARPDASVR